MRIAYIAVFAIVAISVASVLYIDTSTSAVAYAYGYGQYGYSSKVYGGAIERAFAHNPEVFGAQYAKDVQMQRTQQYMYANQDQWDCSYGKEAESSPYPCMWDDTINRYCCIVHEPSTSLSG